VASTPWSKKQRHQDFGVKLNGEPLHLDRLRGPRALHALARVVGERADAARVRARHHRVALSQLLDNLISNSFEHGGGAIVVDVRVEGRLFSLAVRDTGRGAVGTARRGRLLGQRLGGRNRHGHGLAIVRRAVARHGGSFRLRHSGEGGEARVALPLCEEAR